MLVLDGGLMRSWPQAIEDAALAVMETYKALEGELEEKKASLTAMEKEFEKHKAVVAKARSAQVDVENELMVRLPASCASVAASVHAARLCSVCWVFAVLCVSVCRPAGIGACRLAGA